MLIVGSDVRGLTDEVSAQGANKIYLAQSATFEKYSTEGYAAALSTAIEQIQPSVVLLAHTSQGKDVAPRVAARLDLGLATDVTDIKGQAPRWNLSNALSFLRFYARTAAPAAERSGALALENWQFHSKIQKASLAFEQSAVIAGGLTEAKGTVVSTPAGPMLKLDAARLAMQTLLAAVTPAGYQITDKLELAKLPEPAKEK